MNRSLNITRRTFIRLGILGVLGLVGGKGFLNSRRPDLVKTSVNLKRIPAAFDGLKVGQITDIHAGPLVSAELINKGVDLLMAEKPDLIVLTGDFVSGATKFLWTTYGGFKQHHFLFVPLKSVFVLFSYFGKVTIFISGH